MRGGWDWTRGRLRKDMSLPNRYVTQETTTMSYCDHFGSLAWLRYDIIRERMVTLPPDKQLSKQESRESSTEQIKLVCNELEITYRLVSC